MANNFWKVKNGLALGSLTSAPSSPANGDIYYNSTDNKFKFYENGVWSEVGGGGGSGEVVSFDVAQASHGLAVLDAIRHNGTSWVKAQANTDSTLATYIVTDVADANNFTASNWGKITATGHGKTVGEYYFLSTSSAGANTSTTPVSGYNQPLFYVEDANTLHLMIQRGVSTELLTGGSGADTSLSNLAAVAINTSLISDTDNTDDLGSAAIRWKDLYAVALKDSSSSNAIVVGSRQLTSGGTVKLDWSGTDVSLNTRKLTNVSNPTAAQDAATKAYVDFIPVTSKTANYTATDADNVILCDATSASFTITLPAVSGLTGKVYHIKKTDSSVNTVTIDGNASEQIDGLLTQVIATQYQTISIVNNGTSWSII